MRQQGPEARFDAARQIDALPQHDGSAQNLGIPLAQFGIADQYDREGRRRKVVQMFETSTQSLRVRWRQNRMRLMSISANRYFSPDL